MLYPIELEVQRLIVLRHFCVANGIMAKKIPGRKKGGQNRKRFCRKLSREDVANPPSTRLQRPGFGGWQQLDLEE